MSDTTDAGIWASVTTCFSAIDCDEIIHIIGSRVVEENQDCWREVNALKAILLEISGLNQQTTKGSRDILKAKSFSEIHYHYADPGTEKETLEYFLKTFYPVDSSKRIIKIREMLNDETDALKKEIEELWSNIDRYSNDTFTDETVNGNKILPKDGENCTNLVLSPTKKTVPMLVSKRSDVENSVANNFGNEKKSKFRHRLKNARDEFHLTSSI